MNSRTHIKIPKSAIFVKTKENWRSMLHATDKYHKIRGHCYYTGEKRGVAYSICSSKCTIHKEIPMVFQNRCKYNYHFIIKESAKEFEKQFTCLGENTEKYITFSVPIERQVTRTDENGGKITKNVSFRLKFIDSARFMASSLSNLVNNLAKEIHKIKCKHWHNDKKW